MSGISRAHMSGYGPGSFTPPTAPFRMTGGAISFKMTGHHFVIPSVLPVILSASEESVIFSHYYFSDPDMCAEEPHSML